MILLLIPLVVMIICIILSHKIQDVERYPDKERAEAGHTKWCEFAKTNPEHVYSVQMDEHVNF